jgi:methionine-rich copper-binding protein CopC
MMRPLLLLLALAVATPLNAGRLHPRLLKSAPIADSRAPDPIRQISLTFNEALDLALTRVTLSRGDTPVQLEALRLATGDDKTIVATVRTVLAPGRYSVRWQVTGDDGHPVRGEFGFEVTAASAATRRPANR